MADDRLTEQDLEAAILNGKIVRRERDRIGRAKYVIESNIPRSLLRAQICGDSKGGGASPLVKGGV